MPPFWIAIAFAIITLACPLPTAIGDEQGAFSKHRGGGTTKIELSDLPSPPETLAKLIKQGDVTFSSGERNSNTSSRPSFDRRRGKLSGETRFQLGFDYRCRSRWRIREPNGQRLLIITVSYQQIKLNRSHEVWFRKRPESSGFWNNKLVLHEFDHVRLSSDPRIQRQFVEDLRKRTTISEEINADVRVTDSYVSGVVDRHANDVFDETIQLINIRYQELDRQTNHGLLPLPENSSLGEWLP